jgi:hypothetical protein
VTRIEVFAAISAPIPECIWLDFCSWQAGPDRINSRSPDALAVAGASVLAFQKCRNDRRKFLSERTIRLARKEEEPSSWWNGAGAVGYPMTSILSETAGARDERKFFNGLIVWPA